MRLSRRHALAAVVTAWPRAAAADEAPVVVLGRFTTAYADDAEHKARASNVALAAAAIEGRVVHGGGILSFNEAVGERTASFGYARSVVLRDGLVAEGTGGGACQVASTLHAAALLAGLDVDLRAPHSRPSAYIRIGLDATVAFPRIDLKLRSPLAVPVTLRARAARGALEVRIEAAAARPRVVLTSEILERTPFSRIVERDRRIEDDAVRLQAFGIPGYRVRRVRAVTDGDGSVRRDVRTDLYPPTNEIVRVGLGFDEARLRRAGGNPLDEADAERDRSAPRVIVEAGLARPALVQLRPSARVTLDNDP